MKALIPAAGSGVRWFPWSRIVPKELLPFHNHPILRYVLDEAVSAAMREIGIIVSHPKPLIKSYVENVWIPDHPDVAVAWFYQAKPSGVGDALLCARHWVKDEPVAVLYPDEVHPKGGISFICDRFYDSPGHWIGLTPGKERRRQMTVALMETDENTFRVRKVNPRASGQRIGYCSGRYVLAKGFSHIQKRLIEERRRNSKEFDDDSLFSPLWKHAVNGIMLPEPIYDMGTPENWSFAIANDYQANRC